MYLSFVTIIRKIFYRWLSQYVVLALIKHLETNIFDFLFYQAYANSLILTLDSVFICYIVRQKNLLQNISLFLIFFVTQDLRKYETCDTSHILQLIK